MSSPDPRSHRAPRGFAVVVLPVVLAVLGIGSLTIAWNTYQTKHSDAGAPVDPTPVTNSPKPTPGTSSPAPPSPGPTSPAPTSAAPTTPPASTSASTSASPTTTPTRVPTGSSTPVPTVSPSGSPSPTVPSRPVHDIVAIVYNSTDVARLAARTADTLERKGWRVQYTDNWRPQRKVTVVYYTEGQVKAARAVVRAIGAGRTAVVPPGLPVNRLIVIAGLDIADPDPK